MKKKILLTILMTTLLVCALAVFANASVPMPEKPDIGVSFGDVTTIDGFTAPSELYVGTTQRVLLTDGNGGYVTYPTYYVTKNNTTFDFDFSKLNEAQSVEYSKKSVVMLEIPTGVTAISNSYFSGWDNFPECLSVQVPGTVTSYGQYMFNKNSIVRIVEFLDGEEPVTMGDRMFGAEWNGGAYMIGYVRFPNNLVSIGNNTFGKADGSSKAIILGANLKTIGTGFFSQATPETKDTFIYVSDNFFAEEELFTSFFGDYQHYHNNHLKLTIFYTGTQEQAQALVDKGLAVQPTDYVWDRIALVGASEYDYETHKPKERKDTTIVYGVGKCDVFYGGHRFKGEDKIVLDNYFEGFGIGDTCVNCEITEIKESFGSMFTYLGYSYTEKAINGNYSMSQFFGVNKENIQKYEELTNTKLVYGVVLSSVANPFDGEFVNSNKVIITEQWRLALDYISIKVTGITESAVEKELLFCMYVNDGGSTYYLDGGKTSKEAFLKSYSDIVEIKNN